MITKLKKVTHFGDKRLKKHFCLFPVKVYTEDEKYYLIVWLQTIWRVQEFIEYYTFDSYYSEWKTIKTFLSKTDAEEEFNI